MALLVRVLLLVFFPISYPISKVLLIFYVLKKESNYGVDVCLFHSQVVRLVLLLTEENGGSNQIQIYAISSFLLDFNILVFCICHMIDINFHLKLVLFLAERTDIVLLLFLDLFLLHLVCCVKQIYYSSKFWDSNCRAVT